MSRSFKFLKSNLGVIFVISCKFSIKASTALFKA